MQDMQVMELSEQIAPPPSEVAIAAVRNSAAVLGDVTWLMMESPWHRGRQVEDFARLVLPPIKLHQFRLYHRGNVPIAFVSWAALSIEAEQIYFDDPSSLAPEDWASGTRLYIVDFVAAPRAITHIARYLRRDPLIARGPVRSVKSRNGRRMLVEISADAEGTHARARLFDR